MTVVFDTSVIVSAIFWHTSTARRCLARLAQRKFELLVTDEIEREYLTACSILRGRKPQQNPSGPLAWLLSRASRTTPAALGKPRSRDPKDDMFIAAALAGGAKYLVTNDRDLLVLGTPFGISIVTPVEFLRAIGD
jgi:putative PIN family toxin of toxin-antitoxin system